MTSTVRETILETLQTLLSTTGTTFYRSREEAIARPEGIVGVLKPLEEEEEYRGAVSIHDWTITVSVIARGAIPDQVADPAVAAAHAAIMIDPTLGGLCALIRSEQTSWDFEIADQNAVAVDVRYRIKYQTRVGTLTTTL